MIKVLNQLNLIALLIKMIKKLNLDLVKKVKLYIQEFKVMLKDSHYLEYKKVKEEDNYKVPIIIK